MPRQPDLSWQMKEAIWDLAAKLGQKFTAIQTSLDGLVAKGELTDNVPTQDKIKGVIEELQSLSDSVVKTLPDHVQQMRHDYAELGTSSPPGKDPAQAERPERCRQNLMPTLLDLREIGPFPLHDYDLALWHSRPEAPCWPIAKGQVCRDTGGKLTIRLDTEEKLEWKYLNQHLQGDPVWDALKDWKQAMAEDLTVRQALLQAIVKLIERPAAEEGLGFPVRADIPRPADPDQVKLTEPAVSFYYALEIHDQVLSQALGLRHMLTTREAFSVSTGYQRTLSLGGGPAIFSPDPAQREAAIAFLLKAQTEWVSLPEVEVAAEAYRQAEARTKQVKDHVERLRLAVGFPQGSTCYACRGGIA